MSLGTQLAAQEVSKRVLGKPELQSRIQQAQALTKTLSELKGAAMKAGQLLSLEAGEFIPPEVAEILSKLQAQAQPLPFEQIQDVLRQELPESWQDLQNFSHLPLGAASIGQVHKAVLHGRDVAVKVQYPGVDQAVTSDLKILRKAADGFLKMSGKKFSLESTFNELKHVLERETNYTLELQNLTRYGEHLKGQAGYRVPEPFPAYCSKKVLTMSWEEGAPIREWIKTKPAFSARENMANKILNLFCMELLDWGLVQTDPNFANYKVHGENLVCLDFGATLEYSPEFRHQYGQLLLGLATGSTDQLFQLAVQANLLDPRESREAQIAFKNLMQVSLEPFNPRKQPFIFSDRDFERRTRQANLQFASLLKYSPPPRHLLFLHRKLGGVFNLVKFMDVRLDLRPYWDRMTSPA